MLKSRETNDFFEECLDEILSFLLQLLCEDFLKQS